MGTIDSYADTMEQGRATGKTTRILLATALAMSEGKKVLIVTYNHSCVRMFAERLVEILNVLCPSPMFVTKRGHGLVETFNGGSVKFLSRYDLDGVRGCAFDEFYPDVDYLAPEELAMIMPSLRTESVVDIDLDEFEAWGRQDVEPEFVEFDMPQDLAGKSSDIEPKEVPRARCTLSSR